LIVSVVEIIFRWGENATLGSFWTRVLDVCYYVVFGMAVIFTVHAFFQLWLPSIMGWYEVRPTTAAGDSDAKSERGLEICRLYHDYADISFSHPIMPLIIQQQGGWIM
jgi:hypothetical protein